MILIHIVLAKVPLLEYEFIPLILFEPSSTWVTPLAGWKRGLNQGAPLGAHIVCCCLIMYSTLGYPATFASYV